MVDAYAAVQAAIATINGASYIGVNKTGTFNASSGISNPSYDWFLKNETENLGEAYLVGSGPSLILNSVSNPNLPSVLSRTFSLYARVGSGSCYSNKLLITTKLRGDLVPFSPFMLTSSQSQNNFSVNPNPSSAYFEVVSLDKTSQFDIKLFNDQGELMMEENSNQVTLRVETKMFLPGSYSIHVIKGDIVEFHHLLIE